MRILLALLIFFGGFPFTATAASVTKSKDPECRVDITGPIVIGDFDRLLQLKDHLLVIGPDSTAAAVICLDSPGGTVFDGLKLAQFIFDNGVSTRVRENKRCYSICAIMFMMGNVRGPEMEHINRRIHASSKLGFHRPNLTARDASNYTAGDIEDAYDFALLTMLEMMNLAIQNEPWGTGQMIEPDLLRIMIETPPHQMYLVERIEEVIRWKIGVDGLPEVTKPTVGHLQFACENLLAHEVGLSSTINRRGSLYSPAAFDLVVGTFDDLYHITNAPVPDGTLPDVYQVRNARTGLGEVWCKVSVANGRLKACGVDGSTGFRMGDCNDEFGWWHHRNHAFYHPASTLSALAETAEQNVEGALSRRCRATLTEIDLTVEQDCLQIIKFGHSGNGRAILHTITWAEGYELALGGDTQIFIVMPQVNPEDAVVIVNGKQAEIVPGGPNETCLRRRDGKMTLCLRDVEPD